MKIKPTLSALVLGVAVAALALPAASLAGHGCNYKGKSSMMFNEYDGTYYRVPGKSGMVYRGVDNQLLPVATYRHVAGVKCEPRAGYWWNTTWMSPSHECYYMVR